MSGVEFSSISAQGAFSTAPSKEDPYVYQVGFGNRFATEAIPGTLPQGRNNPQKAKYGLYTEQLNGTLFVTPRSSNQHAWLYRIRPSVAHEGFAAVLDAPDLEHNFFTINPKISVSPAQLAWDPIPIPSEPTDFIDGLRTVAGVGDSTLREGLAIHLYAANASMGKRAFMNMDGDMLIVPAEGRLDVQTEFGKLMVHVGEIFVIQRGIRYKINLPDGPSRGYIQEIFGGHYELPELGPLGANGMANPRDFEFPVASFDIDQTPWEILYKVSGTLHLQKQQHTPFDVVAWHGNYVPYKYNLDKFVRIGSISHDHLDPSVFCVLTAKSKTPNMALTDFAIFTPRWDVAEQTFRPPFFHRNAAAEFVGMVYGKHGAGNETFSPGSVHFVNSFSPHGVDSQMYKLTSEMDLKPMLVHENTILILFEISLPLSLTSFAMNASGKKPAQRDPKIWKDLRPEFLDNLEEVNRDLRALGLPELKKA